VAESGCGGGNPMILGRAVAFARGRLHLSQRQLSARAAVDLRTDVDLNGLYPRNEFAA